MITEVVITLPWPPSVNRYWRSVGGRVLVSKAGREYRDAVAAQLYGTGCRVEGRLEVCVVAEPPDRRARDLDNLLKAALDAMQYARVYDSDSQIDRLSVTRGGVRPGGRLAVNVKEIGRA